ncbi:MAG: AarF/ABC1/UbiB kinase family protein [Paracoccaceae bacterium]
MSFNNISDKTVPVPASRVSRFARVGGLAADIAGNMAVNGVRQLVQGQRPNWNGLLLSPANARKLADQLAQMRGAAMKVGQLMSMDSGTMLPPEFAQILARLRSEAEPMPPSQLKKVLTQYWGPQWLQQFASFDVRPIAAASIGQVHRAKTKDGRELALKIQYPGIRKSIDSDVDNIAMLIKISGLLPKGLDIASLLDQAKQQLHDEAQYQREGQYLQHFGRLLADNNHFQVPVLYGDLTTPDILAMSYVSGHPIEALASAPQAERDRVVGLLIQLLLFELFDFQLMQTDPNFANYKYNPETKQVVLLDFGATRALCPTLVKQFRRLLGSGLENDKDAILDSMHEIGYCDDTILPHHQTALLNLFDLILSPFRQDAAFDFSDGMFAAQVRDAAMALGKDGDFWHIPPVETLFLHRKFGGIYLLANKLGARVNVRQLVTPYGE